MKANLYIDKLLVFSTNRKKSFSKNFSRGINLIYGKNTSGKSTVFQSIIYTMGVNDNSHYLKEILSEDVIFRLDCTVNRNEVTEKVIFIRDDETLYVKIGNGKTNRFNGISSDVSVEHIKFKQFFNGLMGFNLKLESKSGYKTAPIETMLLPYYISQSVGWVYIRKSFSNLDFFRGFKEDYLDYYLGIDNNINREKKQELENRLKEIENSINHFVSLEKEDIDIQVTKLVDEEFVRESSEYINKHRINQKELISQEENLIRICNELSHYEDRLKVIRNITKLHEKQNPINSFCPTCKTRMEYTTELYYKHLQEENDTKDEEKKYREKIKKLQSAVNSSKKLIEKLKEKIEKEYTILKTYNSYNVTFDNWMKDKANIRVIKDLSSKVLLLEKERIEVLDELKEFKTEDDVEKSRTSKNYEFSDIFSDFMRQLKVKELTEDRYKFIYRVSAFPSQGVELHKTILAYHFAFNKIISKTQYTHRFPFMLDAIFKEDIESDNKNLIIDFISKNGPKDTQLIFSVAETKEQVSTINQYNINYFKGKANIIDIGEGLNERAFLSNNIEADIDDVEITLEIMNS